MRRGYEKDSYRFSMRSRNSGLVHSQLRNWSLEIITPCLLCAYCSIMLKNNQKQCSKQQLNTCVLSRSTTEYLNGPNVILKLGLLKWEIIMAYLSSSVRWGLAPGSRRRTGVKMKNFLISLSEKHEEQDLCPSLGSTMAISLTPRRSKYSTTQRKLLTLYCELLTKTRYF